MKYFIILILIFILNCSGNKVTNSHGTKLLNNKYKMIEVNVTNKNDLIKILGAPSTTSDFDKNIWFYFERLKTNQSLIKLGAQKIKRNNILIVKLDNKGILKSKELLDLNDMNDINYIKTVTTKEFKNNNLIYGIFSSLREKINAPLRNR